MVTEYFKIKYGRHQHYYKTENNEFIDRLLYLDHFKQKSKLAVVHNFIVITPKSKQKYFFIRHILGQECIPIADPELTFVKSPLGLLHGKIRAKTEIQ